MPLPADSQIFLRDLDMKLWTAADRLRSNLDAGICKHAVLGLIFQNSAKLPPGTEIFPGKGAQASRLFLKNEKNTGKMPMLPYKGTCIGKLIDDVLEAIEKENLDGAEPRADFVIRPSKSVADHLALMIHGPATYKPLN